MRPIFRWTGLSWRGPPVPGMLQDKGVAREFLQVLVDQGEGGGTIGEAILGART